MKIDPMIDPSECDNWTPPQPIRTEGVRPNGISYGACPRCGDSLQTYQTTVWDHGQHHTLYVAWCADCRDVKGYVVVPEQRKP
jgi:hypothetical protein